MSAREVRFRLDRLGAGCGGREQCAPAHPPSVVAEPVGAELGSIGLKTLQRGLVDHRVAEHLALTRVEVDRALFEPAFTFAAALIVVLPLDVVG